MGIFCSVLVLPSSSVLSVSFILFTELLVSFSPSDVLPPRSITTDAVSLKLDQRSSLLLLLVVAVVDVDSSDSSSSSSSLSTSVVENVASVVVVVSFSGDDVGMDERDGLDVFGNAIDTSKVILGAGGTLSVPDCVGIVVIESDAADGRGVVGRTEGVLVPSSRVSTCVGINVGIKLDNIVGTSSLILTSV